MSTAKPNPTFDSSGFRVAADIRGYHAHVYFEPAARAVAERLRAELTSRFVGTPGRIHDEPIGPHSLPMFQFAFSPAVLTELLPWLMLNRAGLSVMIHPQTGDEVEDHATNPIWLGPKVALNIEFIRDWLARNAPNRSNDPQLAALNA